MSLLEVSIHADGEAAEAISELFNRLVPGGAVLEVLPPDKSSPALATAQDDSQNLTGEVVVKVYLPPSEEQPALRRAVEEGLWHLRVIYPFPEPEFRELVEADWAEAWKQDYTSQRVGRHLVVVPSWLDFTADPTDHVVRLDPGMAFGTGLHPSTRLCCAALEDVVRAGDHCLDVGTGSGILAIVAARLGAARVLGVDVDPVAVQVARDNVTANGVAERVAVEPGSIQGEAFVERGTWTVVVANIIAPVIVGLAPDLARCLAASGRLIVSGIVGEQVDAVAVALAAAGLAVTGVRRQGEWAALLATKP